MVSSSRLPYTCTPSERQSAPSTRELRSIGLAARQLQQARSLLKGGTPVHGTLSEHTAGLWSEFSREAIKS